MPHNPGCRVALPAQGAIMERLLSARRVVSEPLMLVLGVLVIAGAAKSGYGAWAASGALMLPVALGASVTFTAIRTWRREAPVCARRCLSAAFCFLILCAMLLTPRIAHAVEKAYTNSVGMQFVMIP